MEESLNYIICRTCGVQYSTTSAPPSCKICDDPRQFVPPTGQSWTTLSSLQSEPYTNKFTPDLTHPKHLISIQTTPKLGIGHRALLCRHASGTNILWDCLTYIDEETVTKINELGGIDAIVISHPHYYGTHVVWGQVFKCPVYLAGEDEWWVMRRLPTPSSSDLVKQIFWKGSELTPLEHPDFSVIKTGGHFPGSSVLYWKSLKTLLVADTIAVVPSGMYQVDRLPGTVTFTFMWSYPNMIPLPPQEVHNIWKAISHAEFDAAHGAFTGTDVRENARQKVLESAQIIVKAMGYSDHPILLEK